MAILPFKQFTHDSQGLPGDIVVWFSDTFLEEKHWFRQISLQHGILFTTPVPFSDMVLNLVNYIDRHSTLMYITPMEIHL